MNIVAEARLIFSKIFQLSILLNYSAMPKQGENFWRLTWQELLFSYLPTTSHWYIAFFKSQVKFQDLKKALTTNLENENIKFSMRKIMAINLYSFNNHNIYLNFTIHRDRLAIVLLYCQ